MYNLALCELLLTRNALRSHVLCQVGKSLLDQSTKNPAEAPAASEEGQETKNASFSCNSNGLGIPDLKFEANLDVCRDAPHVAVPCFAVVAGCLLAR